MAALKANCPEAATVPLWRTADCDGISSYQRTTEVPPGPFTACWVQTASAPTDGSVWATAWVSRPSDVSIVSVDPAWGAAAGTEKETTVGAPTRVSEGEPAGPSICQIWM